jgi:hypothetical protein
MYPQSYQYQIPFNQIIPGLTPLFYPMQPPVYQPGPGGRPPVGRPPQSGTPGGRPPVGRPPQSGPQPGGPPQSQPPGRRPPGFVPARPRRPQQGQIGTLAVDPGAVRPCAFRFVYLWLENGQQFWAYLVFVGRTSVAGWRWTGFNWVYFGIDTRNIDSFVCY